MHLSSYSSPHHVSKFEASGPQNKVGKENRQHASGSSGKRIDSENWVQRSMSRFELLLPCHVFLASHESRLTVSKPGRSWKCALGSPQLRRTRRVLNQQNSRTAFSANYRVPLANELHHELEGFNTRLVVPEEIWSG